MKTKRRFYSKDFKLMIIELIDSGQSISSVSKEYDLNMSMVSRWRREFNNKKVPVLPAEVIYLKAIQIKRYVD